MTQDGLVVRSRRESTPPPEGSPMTSYARLPSHALLTVILSAGLCAAAAAAGSASSVASQGSSASIGGSSTSLETSSESSTRNDRVAAGRYRIEAVADAVGRPGMVRLALAPVAEDAGRAGTPTEPFALILPAAAYDASRLGPGDTVRTAQRPYGLEFARGDDGTAFFLVIDDAAQRELRTRPVAG